MPTTKYTKANSKEAWQMVHKLTEGIQKHNKTLVPQTDQASLCPPCLL
jgi:hypothetical protein